MCTHNAGDDDGGDWFALHGSVYDVTAFAATHPGGSRIVKDVCGLDATRVFRLVAHDVNNEVMGQMASYHIGKLREVSGALMAKTPVGSKGATSVLPELMETVRAMLYSATEVQNCFLNDADSVRKRKSSKIHKANIHAVQSWRASASLDDIRPVVAYVNRFMAALEEEKGGLGCTNAATVRTLACKALERALPTADDALCAWRRDASFRDVHEYASIATDLIYAVDGVASVAARLVLLSKVDMDALYTNLELIVDAAVDTLNAIKRAITAALSGLEKLYAAAIGGGATDAAAVAAALLKCVELPQTLDFVIQRGFASRLAVVVAPVATGQGEATGCASALEALRSLHLEHVTRSKEEDDTLLATAMAKIEKWLTLGQPMAILSARRIAKLWRAHRERTLALAEAK